MNGKRRLVLLCTALALLLTGCFGGREKTNITKYSGCAEPVSARFYYGGYSGEKNIEELPPNQLSALVGDLDAMTYKTHMFHTDYYWAGQFGLELTLADGTFWNYDGTKLELRKVSITESRDNENRIAGAFVEITGGDFWETISKYFDATAEMKPMGTW